MDPGIEFGAVSLQEPAGGEAGAALGAVRLGAPVCGGIEVEVSTRPPVSRSFEPSPAGPGLLVDGLARFRALHRAVAPILRGA